MTSTIRKPHVVGIGGTLRDGSKGLRSLEEALQAAEEVGARTELLDLRELDLPMYEPGKPLEEYGASVERLVEAMRGADALVWSTAAYHGTLAGVTKNALDFTQFMARDEKPYLQHKVVGLVATAGGGMAAVNAINAMVTSFTRCVASWLRSPCPSNNPGKRSMRKGTSATKAWPSGWGLWDGSWSRWRRSSGPAQKSPSGTSFGP